MNYIFDVEVAREYGVNEAIFISNLQFWIAKNKANGIHYHGNRTWTYNSNKAYQSLFPFWSADQLRTVIKHLIDKQVIMTGNYNENKYDRTLWYAFVDEQKWICDIANVDLGKIPNGFGENPKPIPDINTNNKQVIIKEKNKEKKRQAREEEIKKALEENQMYGNWQSVIDTFIDYRAERKKPLTSKGLILMVRKLKELTGGDIDLAEQIIEQSIINGWQGLFPLQNNRTGVKGKSFIADNYNAAMTYSEKNPFD